MKNWKTTLTGLFSGALLVGLDMYQNGETSLKTICISVAIFILGSLAKDHDKTGVR